MKKNIQQGAKILLAVILITWLLLKLDWQFFLQELKGIEVYYIILFFFLQAIAIYCSVKKWQGIAQYQKIPLSTKEGGKVYLIGTFINNFLPSTIGGDIYRSLWLVRSKGAEKKNAFSTVIMDRFSGLIGTLVLALVGGIFVYQYLHALPYFLTVSYVGALAALLFFLVAFLFLPGKLQAVIPWTKLKNFLAESIRYQNTELWLRTSVWTAMFIFFGLGLSNYVLFLALGYTLPFLPFFGLVLLMALYVSLPISINNLGVKEWAYGVLFVLLGVPFEAAIAVAVLSRILQTGISFLALPFYLTEKKIIPVQE